MSYRHLNLSDRYLIEVFLKEGRSYASIAKEIGVHRSTIQREVKRNSDMSGYMHLYANCRMYERKFRGPMLSSKKRYAVKPIRFRMPRFWIDERSYKDRRGERYRKYKSSYRKNLLKRPKRKREVIEYSGPRYTAYYKVKAYYRLNKKYRKVLFRQDTRRYRFRIDGPRIIRKPKVPYFIPEMPLSQPRPPVERRSIRKKKGTPFYSTLFMNRFQTAESRPTGSLCPVGNKPQKNPQFAVPEPLVLF